jgi:hypothetical protein
MQTCATNALVQYPMDCTESPSLHGDPTPEIEISIKGYKLLDIRRIVFGHLMHIMVTILKYACILKLVK